jgi:uncharacterized protein (DUF1330 family)
MPAYIIVEIEVTDPVGYEEYKRMAPVSIQQYGGRYLVRGGEVKTLEGEWPLRRLVILEFPDTAKAESWWRSSEYRPARDLRQRTSRGRMILVEGVRLSPGSR